MAGPDINKEAQSTADDITRVNHDKGSAQAAETLREHFHTMAQSGATTGEMTAYWNKVQENLKGTNILQDMALHYGQSNFDNISQDGKISAYSIKNATTNAELGEQNAWMTNKLAPDAASVKTVGDKAFDAAMLSQLGKQVDGFDHHEGFLWLNDNHYINKDDINTRVAQLDEQNQTARQPFVTALTGQDGAHLFSALSSLSGGNGITSEGLDHYLSAAKDLGRPDSEIKLAQQMRNNWDGADKNDPQGQAVHEAIMKMRGDTVSSAAGYEYGGGAYVPGIAITRESFKEATGLTDAQLGAKK